MDGWGIVVFIAGLILYFVSKKKPIFLLISGIGLGILIGAVWAYNIVVGLF